MTNFSYDLCIWLWNWSSLALHKRMKIPYKKKKKKKTKDWNWSEKTFIKGQHWKVNSHVPKSIQKAKKNTTSLNISLFCRIPANHTNGKWGHKLDVSPCPNFASACMWRIYDYKKHGRSVQPLNKPCNISFLGHVFFPHHYHPPKSQKHKWPNLCINIKKAPYKLIVIPQHEFMNFSMVLGLWIGLSSPSCKWRHWHAKECKNWMGKWWNDNQWSCGKV